MGKQRFEQLSNLLEPSTTVVGIDEHTGLIINMNDKQCHVVGKGSVTIISDQKKPRIFTGGPFHISELGKICIAKEQPANYKSALPWMTKLQTDASPPIQPSKTVLDTCASREQARKTGNWALADLLRNQLQNMGWRVDDTKEGYKLMPYSAPCID